MTRMDKDRNEPCAVCAKKNKPKKKPGAGATQTVDFAIVGDSHVGYQNSLAIFRKVLPKAVGSGNKQFAIFGGDNKHGSTGAQADADYQAFKGAVKAVLDPKGIPWRASIGNWENNTRAQFLQHLNAFIGLIDFPGTNGAVKYVWVDNASGRFTAESLNLLASLSPNYHYVIDCHWPLRVKGITSEIPSDHIVSKSETNKFFRAIPAGARDKVLGIFMHHAHKFYRKLTDVYPGYPNTKFFVCGCSGDYQCRCDSSNCVRGYYNGTLTIGGGGISLEVFGNRT